MEEILISRLAQLITHIESLSETARELLNISEPTEDDSGRAKNTHIKLQSFLDRFNTELINYFRISSNPESADEISSFTSIQIQAEELRIELSTKYEDFANILKESTSKTCVSSKLPKLQLPEFGGDILKWQEFWDQYSSNIHDRNLPDVEKLLYLKSSLKGEASKIVEGLESTNKNYSIAITILRERYGKPNQIIDAHYSALTKVHSAENNTQDCRRVFNETERHLRVLSTLGEDISHNHLRFLLMEKYPEDLIYEIKSRGKGETIYEIRDELNKILTAREEAHNLTQDKVIQDPKIYTTETLHVMSNKNNLRSFSNNNTQNYFNKSYEGGNPRRFIYQPRNTTGSSNPRNTNESHFRRPQFNSPENRNYSSNKPDLNTRGDQRGGMKREHEFQQNFQGSFIKKPKIRCVFCGRNHYSDSCRTYPTIETRKKRLGSRCTICLQENHFPRQCKFVKLCWYCKGTGHHRTLCPSFQLRKNNSTPSTNTNPTTNMHVNNHGQTILQTAIVKAMKSPQDSKYIHCRILLDSGSQRSYVTEKLTKFLDLKAIEENCLSVFTFGAKSPTEYKSPLVKLHLKTKIDQETTLYANVVPVISQGIPYFKETCDKVKSNLLLADDGSLNDQIDILIGNDYYFSLLSTGKIALGENLYLIDSKFGWILTGKQDPKTEASKLSVLTYFQSTLDCKLNKPDLPLEEINLSTLWDLESIGIADSPKTTVEEEAINNFNETTKFINGRYSVRWPWKQYPPNLSSNFGLAYGRLVSLLKRLDDPSLKSYEATLKEQLEREIIEVVPDEDIQSKSNPVHYLPHHGVHTPGKPTRIVYDASAKLKENKSLNQCLYCGPSMTEDLTSILIRFRSKTIGITADVEKAFLQIALQHTERDVTRFLWVKDTTKPASETNLLHLRFCRVPFGVISSPFLLNATIKHHLTKSPHRRIRELIEDIYVDNLVTGSETIKEATELYKNSRHIFREISMNLRCWYSNSKEFLKTTNEHPEENTVKLLGLDWNTNRDTLKLRFTNTEQANTKRGILRNIAQVYDPCGFAAPILLPAKLYLQKLWSCKNIKWDTKLKPELKTEWENIHEGLNNISKLEIPRLYTQDLTKTTVQLHCFSDASVKAYAAAVYIVTNTHTGFVIGKSKVVPLKDSDSLKIPRLELLGALIGSRLLKYTKNSLRLTISKQILWTDSQIVIDWINSDKLLPPFIARRVTEIKQNKELTIRYVPTDLNPADVATRPTSDSDKINYWLQGPKFLKQDQSSWPNRPTQEISFVCREGLSSTENQKISNKDNYIKQDKTIPAIESIRVNNKTEEIKQLQHQYFPNETQGKTTDLSRALKLFTDIDGLLRCKGRLDNVDWPYEKRYPILLPKDCDFTENVIRKIHEDNYHVGANHTLSLIRQLYWIPQGKAKVQRIIHKCLRCIKHGGGPYQLPETPALPIERVNYTTPFTFTGLDYLGPLSIKTENNTSKRWVALFTCLAVRAIHLEVVKDMTAEEGLLALRRLIANRGVPALITSDNAQQFRLIEEILTTPYCIKNQIKWKFIPQLAPWYGGFYERLVALVKHCMKRTLHKHLLSDSQLHTIIKEIETILNTRPLNHIDDEIEHTLRPADFLTLGKCLTTEFNQEEQILQSNTVTKMNLIQSWRRGLKILEEFKEMFQNRYLTCLRERKQHSPKVPRILSKLTPQIGQIVQIKGDNNNRESWKEGKIISLSKGKDGENRVARVKVGNKEFIRSIVHLYPLEMEIEEFETSTIQPNSNENLTSQWRNETELIDSHLPLEQENEETIEETENAVKETTRIESIGPRPGSISHPSWDSESTHIEDSWTTKGERNGKEIERGDIEGQEEKQNTERTVRAASIRAREKIKEWTQELNNLL